ncbi:MAG: aquaporin [Pseudorhodoplanes sp.]
MSFLDNKLRAEFFGTMFLILIGCSAIVLSNFSAATPIGLMPISMAFGLAVAVMAYTIGPITGCHINPAVTAAVWAAGRIDTKDAIAHIVAQVLGAIAGALILFIVLKGRVTGGDITAMGQTTYNPAAYQWWAAALTEFVGTLLFTVVILAVTGPRGGIVAGLIVGIALMLIHFAFINVSGASVNPARSLGPALFVGGAALQQIWLYIVFPLLGGLVGGWIIKSKTLDL